MWEYAKIRHPFIIIAFPLPLIHWMLNVLYYLHYTRLHSDRNSVNQDTIAINMHIILYGNNAAGVCYYFQ